MMKTILPLLVLFFPIPVFAIKILSVMNVTLENMTNEATPGQVIKVEIDYEGTAQKSAPFYLTLDGKILNTKAFETGCAEGKTQTLYFTLDEVEIARVIPSIESKLLVKLDVSDKAGNFTNVDKANMVLLFPGKDLVLKRTTWRLDQEFGVTVPSYQRYAQLPQKKEDLRLYINGQLLAEATCTGVSASNDGVDIFFRVDGTEFGQKFYKNHEQEKLSVGIGSVEKNILYSDTGLMVDYMRSKGKLAYWVIFIGLGVLLIWLGATTDIIKDPTIGDNRKTYSLARTQFAFWTFLILNALTYILFSTKELVELPSSAFILLGISATVTIASQMAENPTATSNQRKQENNGKSRIWQFFADLLSDGQSINIHRFQNLVFTLFLGIYFFEEVINHLTIPNFDNNLLVLMGVSGAAYTVLKGMAGDGKANPTQEQKTQ